MNIDDFRQEVNNNRPRLALAYLVPIIEDLVKANEALTEEVAALKASKVEDTEPAPTKKTPAKKTAAKTAAAKAKEAAEGDTPTE